MKFHQNNGFVILAGAGPGDPELITVKLQKRLQTADVIIVDRLVNPDIIAKNASPQATVIEVGKQGYHDASISQTEINSLIIEHAIDGKTVLRLKGGDVAFFSNVLDELTSLRKNNIPYEIIPGITAASGASAYSGIPLTARGYSQGVKFISFNPSIDFNDEKWKCLANEDDTLIFYMSTKNINTLSEKLLQHSQNPLTPLAVIEQATTKHQQIHLSTLKDCTVELSGKTFSSPSLVIVGNVVKLYKDFNWFRPKETSSVFKNLVTATNSI